MAILKMNCDMLTKKVLSEMEADGYSYSMTHRHVNYIYRSLTKFCNENYDGIYSPAIGQEFLSINRARIPPLRKATFSNYEVSIMRLDIALSGNYHWNPAGVRQKKPYATSCFSKIIDKYEDLLKKEGKKERNIRARIHVLSRFLKYVDDSGVRELQEITPDLVYSGFQAESNKEEFGISVRSFLGYAYKYGLMDKDLSTIVPSTSKHKPNPTVYSHEEVETLLASIDKTTSIGKRDVCIILLAARLGLRSCDIANLKFSNIQWDSKKICLIQEKTGEPIELPLIQEIKESLENYIETARPDSDSEFIFLGKNPPFAEPLKASSIHTIVSRHIDSIGINTSGKKRGAHSLRSSLASHLLEEGNSYPVIQKILGHTSPDAAKAYIRIDIDRLRKCSAAVPAIHSNALENFLKNGGR